MKKYLVLSFLVFLALGASVFAQGPAIKCPKGTKHRKVKTDANTASRPYFAQFEEYCTKRSKNSAVVKMGPYLLWGPNGERLEEGQFVNGKKDGKWKRWIPSQLLEDTWRKGEYVGAVIVGRPSSFVIDVAACNPHEYDIPHALGSTSYQVLGKLDGNCEIKYVIAIEMTIGERPSTSCSVPMSIKKLAIDDRFFSSIQKYCKR